MLSKETFLDSDIKEFIIALNSIPNVETFSSCSGHENNAIVHINFRYNDSTELSKVLSFLRNKGFTVKLIEDLVPYNSISEKIVRHYSVTASLFSKDFDNSSISKFWSKLKEELVASFSR